MHFEAVGKIVPEGDWKLGRRGDFKPLPRRGTANKRLSYFPFSPVVATTG